MTDRPDSPARPQQAERLWTREFFAMVAVRFFGAFGLNAYVAIMALYAMQRFSVGEALAGVASGIFVIGAMVGRFFIGKYTEVIGRDRLLRVSAVAFFVTSLPYLLSPEILGIGGLIAVRFLHGVANGVMGNTSTTCATDFIPRSRLGEGLGYYALGTSVALAVGPMTALWLVHTVGYFAFFVVGSVFAGLCVPVVFSVHMRNVELTPEERDAILHRTSLGQYLDFKTLPLSLCMFFVCLCYSGVTAFLAPYTETLGVASLAGLYFTTYALMLLVVRPFVGRLEDRRGENFVVYPCLVLQIVGYALLSRLGAFAGTVGILGIAVIMSLGQGCFFTALQALVMRDAPPQRMGVVTSTFFLFVDAGVGLGSGVFGSLIPHVGYAGMYFAAAAVVILIAILYTVNHARKASGR